MGRVRWRGPVHKVLILEDDDNLRAELQESLVDEMFDVAASGTVAEFWDHFDRHRPDALVLDMALPDGRGLDVAREVRKSSDIAILFLSGRQAETDRIVALEMGADDFVTKPCSPRELIARLNAVLRRTDAVRESTAPDRSQTLGFAGYRLDLGAMELRDPHGMVCTLTTAEFDLLRAFVERPQRVLSRDQLLDLIRGTDWAGYDRTVDGLVSRLRKKLVTADGETQILRTVRGSGYIFTQQVE